MGFIELVDRIIRGYAADTLEAKFIRFMLHGKANLPVANVVDLRSLTEDELTNVQNFLNEVMKNSSILLRLLAILRTRQMTSAGPLCQTIPLIMRHLDTKWKRKTAFALALKVITTPEAMISFVKYFVQIEPFQVDEDFRHFIRQFYGKYDFKTVAKLVTEDLDNIEIWNHRRIIALGDDYAFVEQRLIQTYALGGLHNLSFFRHIIDVLPLIDYFFSVHKLRDTTDSELACKLINNHNLSISHVHKALLNDKNVNKALIKTMEIRVLLERLSFLQEEDFFRNGDEWDDHFISLVCYRLNSPRDIRKNKIHPSESLIAQEIYLNAYPISKEVVAALESQMETAFVNISEIDVQFNVFIDCHSLKDTFCGQISAHKAAAVLALSLKKAGRNVKIMTSENSNFVEMKESTVSSLSSSIASRSSNSPTAKDFAFKRLSRVSVIIGLSAKCEQFYPLVSDRNIKSTLAFCNLWDAEIGNVKNFKNLLVTYGFNKNTFHIISAFLALTESNDPRREFIVEEF